jgi:hypothetical protein
VRKNCRRRDAPATAMPARAPVARPLRPFVEPMPEPMARACAGCAARDAQMDARSRGCGARSVVSTMVDLSVFDFVMDVVGIVVVDVLVVACRSQA